MIEILNLTFSYNKEPLFRDVNIKIDKGITLFRGPNGSGKTTLAKIISGLLPPTMGKVLIDRIDIYSKGPKAREKLSEVVYVHDKPIILRGSVYKNLTYGMRIQGIDNRERLNTLIEYFGLQKLVDKKSHELSAGQKQIVSLVRALSVDPKYLILDEPLQYLDEERRTKVINYLVDLKKKGYTIVIATHEQELSIYADTIYMIKYGSIELKNPPQQAYNSESVIDI